MRQVKGLCRTCKRAFPYVRLGSEKQHYCCRACRDTGRKRARLARVIENDLKEAVHHEPRPESPDQQLYDENGVATSAKKLTIRWLRG